MLLTGKKILILGVRAETSIAYAVARLAQQQGAEIVLTSDNRHFKRTMSVAGRLAQPCDVLEVDVTRAEQLKAAAQDLDARWGRVDGVLHSVTFAPPRALNGGFLNAAWSDAAITLHTTAYSFVACGRVFGPLLARAEHGSLVGMDFDSAVAWPGYDWAGVAKAGLESSCRYLAQALGAQGTRVNLVAAGPLRTPASSGVASMAAISTHWSRRAPLGWDDTDTGPVARVACALLSEWMPAVTGEIVHADGGVHAVGMPWPVDGDPEPDLAHETPPHPDRFGTTDQG
ncbi:enoyl-ACP reductase FabI [Nocardia sp. NPDC050799]|uniref:enoyl-ACP reductase FabI n=1 Tax=Nocardia sp. NPDC050799 TaxID=3154842 RepID=UPI0033CE6884